jgi:hypothetical protein
MLAHSQPVDPSLHLASNWECDFSLQVHVISILIIIIPVRCLNFANLIVFIQLILRGLPVWTVEDRLRDRSVGSEELTV